VNVDFRLSADHGRELHRLQLDVPMPKGRRAALESFASLDLPSTEDELWRYTDVTFLGETVRSLPEGILDSRNYAEPEPLHSGSRSDALGEIASRTGADEGVILDLAHLSGILALRDGVPGPLLISENLLRNRAVIRAIPPTEDPDHPLWFELVSPTQDKFTSLVAAFGVDLLIDIPDGVVIEEPLVVSVSVTHMGQAKVVPLHITLKLGENSKIPLFVHYSGTGPSDGEPSLLLPVTEVSVGEGSKLSYVVLQELEHSVCNIETSRVSLGRDAWLSSTVVSLGARLSRHRVETAMAGENSQSEMLGIYFGNSDQHLDFRTLQDHQAPRTVSDLLYKGAVEDDAKAVYAGLVRVEKDAQKINGFQTNKNLVLSEGASAESIPNLEILANDVRCSHASSIGPVDEEEVYYLQSRGIDPDLAEELIVEGFFEEVIERIPSGMTAERIRKEVSEKFASRESR